MAGDRIPLLDFGGVPDVFCNGIGKIERLNGETFRFTMYVEQYPEAGQMQWVKCASLLWPLSAIPGAIKQVADAITKDKPLLFDQGGAVMTVN